MNDLFDLPTYPDAPGAKVPGTSTEAAHKMQSRASALRDKVESLFLTGATKLTCPFCRKEARLLIRDRRSGANAVPAEAYGMCHGCGSTGPGRNEIEHGDTFVQQAIDAYMAWEK